MDPNNAFYIATVTTDLRGGHELPLDRNDGGLGGEHPQRQGAHHDPGLVQCLRGGFTHFLSMFIHTSRSKDATLDKNIITENINGCALWSYHQLLTSDPHTA